MKDVTIARWENGDGACMYSKADLTSGLWFVLPAVKQNKPTRPNVKPTVSRVYGSARHNGGRLDPRKKGEDQLPW